MASLYRKPVFLRDPNTGLKCKTQSRKWWGRFKDAFGREKRVPLATDKRVSQAMLNDLVKRVEREQAGLIDPLEEHAKRPFREHLADFQDHLKSKGDCPKHIEGTIAKLRRIAQHAKWRSIRDVSAAGVNKFLVALRGQGFSVQTRNHYLRAIKHFSRWLVHDRRATYDTLAHLSMQNPEVDRRRMRRPLLAEEFARLVEAAQRGRPVESLPGPDRAMMYVLAAWTGYRKGEIGSLTKRSFQLDALPATVTVAASYSKRKRHDTQVLHSEVVARLQRWLAGKQDLGPDVLLFPVCGKVPGGVDRKTAKMMRRDLEAARRRWIEESGTKRERQEREASDFLRYRDGSGRYADFHSHRHTFITSLERAGVRPRTAQALARHSDIRLTMGIYTHIGLDDQTAAIESLPAPPEAKRGDAGTGRPDAG
jgi:integrase/recombinase XerD